MPGARLSVPVAVAVTLAAVRRHLEMPGEHFELGDLPLLLLVHTHVGVVIRENAHRERRESEACSNRARGVCCTFSCFLLVALIKRESSTISPFHEGQTKYCTVHQTDALLCCTHTTGSYGGRGSG